MTPEDFDRLFDRFTATCVRLEALPVYDVDTDEVHDLKAWRDGTARPLRSILTDPWLARLAASTAGGKRWSRVRVVSEPPTDYERWELTALAESQTVGEEVLVAHRADTGQVEEDFWLFDYGLPSAQLVAMHYDTAGRWQGAELVDDPVLVEKAADRLRAVRKVAVPLNEHMVVSNA